MARFFTDITAAALQLDGLMHTHPVSLPVTDPTQINSLFDDISYNKVLLSTCIVMSEIAL